MKGPFAFAVSVSLALMAAVVALDERADAQTSACVVPKATCEPGPCPEGIHEFVDPSVPKLTDGCKPNLFLPGCSGKCYWCQGSDMGDYCKAAATGNECHAIRDRTNKHKCGPRTEYSCNGKKGSSGCCGAFAPANPPSPTAPACETHTCIP